METEAERDTAQRNAGGRIVLSVAPVEHQRTARWVACQAGGIEVRFVLQQGESRLFAGSQLVSVQPHADHGLVVLQPVGDVGGLARLVTAQRRRRRLDAKPAAAGGIPGPARNIDRHPRHRQPRRAEAFAPAESAAHRCCLRIVRQGRALFRQRHAFAAREDHRPAVAPCHRQQEGFAAQVVLIPAIRTGRQEHRPPGTVFQLDQLRVPVDVTGWARSAGRSRRVSVGLPAHGT